MVRGLRDDPLSFLDTREARKAWVYYSFFLAVKTRLVCFAEPTRQARHGMSVALAKYNDP
jgi:hypothetical protein